MPVLSPLSNRRVDLAPSVPGLIEMVSDGSFGHELGLKPGDRIVSVNDRPVLDAIDFQFHAQSEQAVFVMEREGIRRRFDLDLEGDEFWGITFSDPTFDGVRVCENACPFCFIKQIPKGMRKSLYVMDDDFRYSMLYGSFVTLTNLSEADWQRIEEQRLGPMHVSVHATEPELRVALVGNPNAGKILEDLGRLERNGLDFHSQLVLCPGVNDGEAMERSLHDLSQFKHCLSVAGVPVGLTKYGLERQSKQVRLSRTCMRTLPGKQISVRRYEPYEARAVVEMAERWQARYRHDSGKTWFHLGDEFYLMCGLPVPGADVYDGYPQIEDGIGITRHFLENLESYIKRTKSGNLAGAVGTIATATLIAPTMHDAVARFNAHTGSDLDVVIVENQFFGKEINISGLLTGKDVADAVNAANSHGAGPLFISSKMVSDRTSTLMDDLTVADLARLVGRPVVPAGLMSEVGRTLRERLRRVA